ncbi:hypothetical protein [Catelliglobosispora koreensis]|uniref:hypothetical protein n=1 Tax=Catelliglobosispora koreensis TaxID=129052 RepID=UPI00037595C4|nr:hypothetical protein [Catelliglobosispora koreensis]
MSKNPDTRHDLDDLPLHPGESPVIPILVILGFTIGGAFSWFATANGDLEHLWAYLSTILFVLSAIAAAAFAYARILLRHEQWKSHPNRADTAS